MSNSVLSLLLGDRGGGISQTIGGTPTPTPSSPFASIQANGWEADYAATPSIPAPVPFMVTRPGYDATAAVISVADTAYVTQRVRQVYPNQASLTALSVALSEPVAAADTLSGATNNSALVVPAPIVNWSMIDRQLIGNSLDLEVTGNHYYARNGQPFRCVVFTVTDGTTTLTQTISTLSVSGHAFDRCAVQVFKATFNTTSLIAGLITCNAKVYPWAGAAIVDTSAGTPAQREFGPRYFWKNVALQAAPPFAYVASTGVDATGVVSTTAAVASVTPFLTIKGAIDGLIAATGATGGFLDGCRIRVKDTVAHGGNGATSRPMKCVPVIIERDPTVSKAVAIVQMTAIWRPRIGLTGLVAPLTEAAIQFSDVTLQRTGAFTFQGESASSIPLRVYCTTDAVFDCGASSATWLNASHLYVDGGTWLSATSASALSVSAGGEIRLLRGLSTDRNGGGIENYLVLGCAFDRPGGMSAIAIRSENGSIIQFNKFTHCSSQLLDVGSDGPISQYSFSAWQIEWINTVTSTPAFRVAGDGKLGSLTHVLIDNGTLASAHYQAGRPNVFYDETVGTVRTHTFSRMRNCLLGSFYIKEGVFVGTNGNGSPNPGDAPSHIGNWWALYGTGFKNVFTLLVNPGANNIGGSEGFAYPGLGSSIGTSNTTPQFALNTIATNWQATTSSGTTPVAGTGGGDYTVPSGSPLIGLVAAVDEVFGFDLAGVARTRGTIGAYA